VGIVLVLALLGLWELMSTSGNVSSISLPSVHEVFAAWWRLLEDGSLFDAIVSTLKRMFAGFGLAAAVGIPLGLLMGLSKWAFGLFEPLTELLRPIPSPAYIPIGILVLGLGDSMKIAVVFIASLFPILLNSYQGVIGIDRVVLDTGRTFGLSRFTILRKIALPAALPSILTGLRISLGISFIVVVVAEMLVGGGGIGFLIVDGQRTFHVEEMYAGIFTLAVLGYFFNWVFVRGERFLLRGWDRAFAG
jgi:ABC-type nitrate/sulfonate/bicarbonate transport system permease component